MMEISGYDALSLVISFRGDELNTRPDAKF